MLPFYFGLKGKDQQPLGDGTAGRTFMSTCCVARFLTPLKPATDAWWH
jgi:hypothetical protein